MSPDAYIMSTVSVPYSTAAAQRGMALIMGLVFLVVLTIIGLTAARMAGLEERMAGNMRDRALAMQAAELTLRDAERDITNVVGGFSRGISGISGFVSDCGASTNATDADDGLCYNGTSGYASPKWMDTNIMTAAPSVVYGRFTNAPAIPLVSAQPRYLVEGFRKQPPGADLAYIYRITVRAQGANANTVVWLQEVFKP